MTNPPMTKTTRIKDIDVSQLVNDREIDLLADLFLARYGFDTASKSYRRFKNAMIVLSHDFADTDTELQAVARLDGITESTLIASIESAVNALPRPMHETYNAHYGIPISELDAAHITMPEDLSVMDTLKFLAAVFLTIITTNYPKYEYIDY